MNAYLRAAKTSPKIKKQAKERSDTRKLDKKNTPVKPLKQAKPPKTSNPII